MKKLIKAAATATVVAAALGLVKCEGFRGEGPVRTVGIAALIGNPEEHDGKLVSFHGRVLDRVSLIGASGYRVGERDGAWVTVAGLTGRHESERR